MNELLKQAGYKYRITSTFSVSIPHVWQYSQRYDTLHGLFKELYEDKLEDMINSGSMLSLIPKS